MKQLYAYTRVSTLKQGEQGVSLKEQRDAIERYASRNALTITEWFEERETAAKRGRPVFSEMLRRLKRGKASGVIIHKIDRSARNLRDWADLGELIDAGIQVHFANESLDLNSRGGRLSADIQAVVAADFIRNLREETRKGFYGRLKQGLYPLPAPLGYLDCGPGKQKEPDPAIAPLIRRTFQLYSSGTYTLDSLLPELSQIGLRNRRGTAISKNGLATILRNPFYLGLIRVRHTGELFQGGHQPTISKALFDRVQAVLDGRISPRTQCHDFLFRRLLSCARCTKTLTGELQKGHVYYRCHSPRCRVASIREETAETRLLSAFEPIQFTAPERAYLAGRLSALLGSWQVEQEAAVQATSLTLAKNKDRLGRLTDAFLDGSIDKELYEERKEALLLERAALEENLASMARHPASLPERLAGFFELADAACSLYKSALPVEKRELVETLTSNRRLDGKSLDIVLAQPFRLIAERQQNTHGVPYRDSIRTFDRLLKKLFRWFKEHPEVSFSLKKGLPVVEGFFPGAKPLMLYRHRPDEKPAA